MNIQTSVSLSFFSILSHQMFRYHVIPHLGLLYYYNSYYYNTEQCIYWRLLISLGKDVLAVFRDKSNRRERVKEDECLCICFVVVVVVFVLFFVYNTEKVFAPLYIPGKKEAAKYIYVWDWTNNLLMKLTDELLMLAEASRYTSHGAYTFIQPEESPPGGQERECSFNTWSIDFYTTGGVAPWWSGENAASINEA